MELAPWVAVGLSSAAVIASAVWTVANNHAYLRELRAEMKAMRSTIGGVKNWLEAVDRHVDQVDNRLSRLEGLHNGEAGRPPGGGPRE